MGDVETSTVPDWLEKLEKRRELVSKGRLGHESGAGAPCLVCGEPELIYAALQMIYADYPLFQAPSVQD